MVPPDAREEEKISDQLLLLRLRDGNIEAFDALYEKYWQLVYDSAFKRIQDVNEAKDITQEIFLNLWARRSDIQIGNLPGYLTVAVKNKVFNIFDKKRRFVPVPDLVLELRAAIDQTDGRVLNKEVLDAYEALIDSLPVAQQRIFRMRYQEDLSSKEIAERLDISRKTVQNQLGRAVAQIRSSLMLATLLVLLNKP